MRLEIRDAEDQTVYDIGPEGAVLGRERAKTDISLRDESISKRHARIFHDDGAWFLEDLGSSNGTYVDDQRISGPVLVNQGMAFSLAQRRFEIVYIDGPGGGAVDDFPPPGMMPPHQEETGGDMPPLPGMESQVYVPAEGHHDDASNDFGGMDDEAENTGIKYFFVAVPKAIAYYLIKVPLFAVNPIGFIRKGVEEQPLPALSKMEVAAYAIPAGIIGALVGGVFGAIAALVNGAFGAAITVLIAALPSAAIAGAIGGVFGFFAHPITEFLVRILKGESNPRCRSNFFITAYTFSILSAVPNGIAAVVSALPIPFISLLGPLLSVLVTLVGLFMFYLWVKAARVHKAVQYVVLVLGLLSVVGTGIGFVTGLISQISNLGSGGGDAGDTPGLVADTEGLTDEQRALMEAQSEAAAEAAEQLAAAEKAAAEAGGDVDERTKAALEAARKKSAEAAAMAAKQAAAAQKAAAEATAAAEKAADEKVEDVMPEKAPPPPPTRAAPPPPTRSAPPPPTRSAPPPTRKAASGPINTDEHPLGQTPFVAFIDKRNAVERAIDDDPSLLRRADIKRDYERMWRATYDIREKYRKRYRKKDRWERDKVGMRLKGLEIYEKTNPYVERLYANIFGG